MIGELNDAALEFGQVVQRALEDAGGEQLAPLAIADPDKREALVAPVLEGLGVWDIDPRGSADEADAAAAVCRSAGAWAVAYPVAERLSRPADLDADGLLVVNAVDPAAAVAGLDLRWIAVDLDGRRSTATPTGGVVNPRKDAFVTRLALAPIDEAGATDLAWGLVLPCWTLLGMLDRAVTLTGQYILEREQFGQRLANFQGVQFQLTDAEVERLGLEEQAKYALWSVQTGRPEALHDALALRLAALRASDTVLRVAHQLHGAIGFCDETYVSWVSRASVPLRRYPLGVSGTRSELVRRIGRAGLTGLFHAGADE